jgi:hypothetical protein
MQVRAICDHYREERDLKKRDLNDKELSVKKQLRRETNEK